MAHTFVVVRIFFVITVDGIPFIFTHLAISWYLGSCSCLEVFCNLVPLMGCKNHISSKIHNLFLIDFFCAYNQSIQEFHRNSSCHGDDVNFLHLHSLSIFPLYLPSTNDLLCRPFPLQIINNVSWNQWSAKTCNNVLKNFIVKKRNLKVVAKKIWKKNLVIRC